MVLLWCWYRSVKDEVLGSTRYNCPPPTYLIWDLPGSKLRIHRQSEEFRPKSLNLTTSLRQTMVLNAELKSINITLRVLLPVGKVHKEWHHPRGCTVPVKFCMFKTWGLSLKPSKLLWQQQETNRLESFFHYVCEYACLCVCVSRSDRKSLRKTKKQITYVIS